MAFTRSVLWFIVLSLVFGAFSQPAAAQQPKVLAPHKPVAPRIPRNRKFDPPSVPQSATGGFWMIDANFKSTLYLGSMLKWDSLAVTPIVHLSNGAAYSLPAVTLEPSGTAAISINQALADQGMAPYATLFGYIEVQYKWGWDAICGTVWNVDTLHSLIFVDTLRPPPTAVASPGPGPDASSEPPRLLEGMWWKQEKNVTGFIALSNVTTKPIAVSVRVIDSANQELGNHTTTISAHGTKMIELNELLSASTSTGGLIVTWSGHESELMINAELKDQAVGYSARLPLGPRPNSSAKISQNSYGELGLMSGLADPMMNFPSGTVFTPYSVLRNLSDQPVSVTLTLWWIQGGTPHSVQLPTLAAAPHQTQTLDVPALVSSAGLKNFSGSMNLVLDTNGPQGALLLSSGSVDQTHTYVFEVIPRGISPSAAKGLPYWSTGNGDDTMITIWNPADEAQDFVFTLFYTGGHYGYPIHLEPRTTQSLNISEIIHSRIPDADGNLIPLSVQSGSAEISGPQGENQEILVVIDAGIYNVRKATCGTLYCSTCDGETAAWINLNPFTVAVGNSIQQTSGYEYNTGTQYDTTSSSSWSSSNTSVATVSTGLTNGVSVGSATLTSAYFQSVPVFDHPCQYVTPPSCPYAYTTPSPNAGGNTTPTISGPNTLWWFNGLGAGVSGYTTQITLTASSGGTGTSYQWAITAGSDKVSLSTSTSATVQVTSIGKSSNANDVSITVTIGSITSDPFKLTVRAPYTFGTDPNHPTPIYSQDPTYVWDMFIPYLILDNLLTPMPSPVSFNENWTTAVVPDYPNENWPNGAASCATTSTSEPASMGDHINGVTPNHIPTPVYNTQWNGVAVDHIGQEWRVGTCQIGYGPRVQTDTLQDYTDHAAHNNIVSPAP